MEERYLTVTALTKYIKYKFDHDHNLEEVLLEGEVSNFKHNSRGHFYFTLKDENAQISATMFQSYAKNVKFEPEDGMKVFVKGVVTVYEPSGTYQINVREMKSDGVGDLYLAYEKLKAELEKEGLFDPNHKKPIPRFPKTIGVITSPTGAAIRDIINTVGRRYPLAHIILYPAIVQGDDAKDNIAMQIKKANLDGLADVLIVGRGGGSIEDLWAFNEKVVAYAIYDSIIPIISAVGHEIDFTIADFVADQRAATPTAAAEIATPNVLVLKENIISNVKQMEKRIRQMLYNKQLMMAQLDKRLESRNPLSILRHKEELLESDIERLNMRIYRILESKKHQYEILRRSLDSNNPLAIMDKGYSISSVNDKIVTSVKDIKIDDTMTTKMKNGVVVSKVMEVLENGKWEGNDIWRMYNCPREYFKGFRTSGYLFRGFR
ncbi:exodeoxyribonuclease VII large subunit [Anaeroplasma bactoclasticum]|uniref:Exodeoxyribonuclease 7 large subunit n=2 Tax=Anaeroplasma bactoclasticum TaxID=2088 RepID=A0A397RZJ1_9MOLU|nr:exodeoxyribonuclease VII large subunit [Anaeroplasma bactoclasticum]